MSSQAERIKAFKLAQHARLQKQDEEEQWISSEELCTEGSSDEETHISSSSKTSHRKQKRNPRTEKRGISPLAQPPKATETESTSTYQRDSKYLLPDMQIPFTEKQSTSGMSQPETLILRDDLHSVDTKVEKLDLISSQAHSSKAGSSSLESEETDEDAEIEKMIQWRPKRGSIKLPDFPEGELERPATIQHTIFEVDAFYMEMVSKINFLKRTPPKTRCKNSNKCEMESLVSALEKKKKNPHINNLLGKIFKLDIEISEKNDLFEIAKKERLLAQEEMCNTILTADMSVIESKNSQIFLHLCSIEKNDDDTRNAEENYASNKSSDQQTKKQNKAEKHDRNFVDRNIKLAKEHSMTQFSLTDEEKVKLESLLSDIDSEEYSMDRVHTETTKPVQKSIQEPTKHENCETSTCDTLDEKADGYTNYFKLQKEEMCTIEDLNIKLNEILKSYGNEGDTAEQPPVAKIDNEDLLKCADNEGRYWKHHQLQKRLENIERDLANIAARDEEQKIFVEKNQRDMQENGKLDEDKDNDDCEEKE